MAPRSAFVVVLIWGLVGSTDAAQVARDKNPQALRKKSIPVEDQNTLLDATLLSALTPFDSSKGKPGDNRQIKNLLRMASGTDRLNPDAFDALFETLRTSTKTTLNTSVEGIESDYNGHVAAITACETNHGFHGAPANARRIAYDAAVQSYENATQVAEQKCSTQTSKCNDQRTKAMALHNYVQTDIVNTYGCAQTSVQCPPTVFGLTDFYLKDTDNVVAEVKAKHTAWDIAAGMCSTATGECDNANEDKKAKCDDVDVVAVNGRNAYDQCYGQHQGIVSGFDVDARIANQKTEVRNLEKVLCIVKVAVDSHGDTPKKDSAITCTDLGVVPLSPAGGAIEYKCVCTSPSSSPPTIYSETYVTQLTLDPVPNKDTAWDPLGCAGSVISTTGITTQQPTTSQMPISYAELVETSVQDNNQGYAGANIVLDDQNPRDPATETYRWWTGSGCKGGNPYSVCDNIFVVVAFPEVTTAGSLEFITYQDSYGPWKMRISSATAQAGPYGNAQDFNELPSASNTVGNTGLTAKNHHYMVPRNVLTFNPPLIGRFFKIQILENHGSTGTGFYRVYFKGPAQATTTQGPSFTT